MTKPYDTTLARMAGNIAAGLAGKDLDPQWVVEHSVDLAQRIIAIITPTENQPVQIPKPSAKESA